MFSTENFQKFENVSSFVAASALPVINPALKSFIVFDSLFLESSLNFFKKDPRELSKISNCLLYEETSFLLCSFVATDENIFVMKMGLTPTDSGNVLYHLTPNISILSQYLESNISTSVFVAISPNVVSPSILWNTWLSIIHTTFETHESFDTYSKDPLAVKNISAIISTTEQKNFFGVLHSFAQEEVGSLNIFKAKEYKTHTTNFEYVKPSLRNLEILITLPIFDQVLTKNSKATLKFKLNINIVQVQKEVVMQTQINVEDSEHRLTSFWTGQPSFCCITPCKCLEKKHSPISQHCLQMESYHCLTLPLPSQFKPEIIDLQPFDHKQYFTYKPNFLIVGETSEHVVILEYESQYSFQFSETVHPQTFISNEVIHKSYSYACLKSTESIHEPPLEIFCLMIEQLFQSSAICLSRLFNPISIEADLWMNNQVIEHLRLCTEISLFSSQTNTARVLTSFVPLLVPVVELINSYCDILFWSSQEMMGSTKTIKTFDFCSEHVVIDCQSIMTLHTAETNNIFSTVPSERSMIVFEDSACTSCSQTAVTIETDSVSYHDKFSAIIHPEFKKIHDTVLHNMESSRHSEILETVTHQDYRHHLICFLLMENTYAIKVFTPSVASLLMKISPCKVIALTNNVASQNHQLEESGISIHLEKTDFKTVLLKPELENRFLEAYSIAQHFLTCYDYVTVNPFLLKMESQQRSNMFGLRYYVYSREVILPLEESVLVDIAFSSSYSSDKLIHSEQECKFPCYIFETHSLESSVLKSLETHSEVFMPFISVNNYFPNPLLVDHPVLFGSVSLFTCSSQKNVDHATLNLHDSFLTMAQKACKMIEPVPLNFITPPSFLCLRENSRHTVEVTPRELVTCSQTGCCESLTLYLKNERGYCFTSFSVTEYWWKTAVQSVIYPEEEIALPRKLIFPSCCTASISLTETYSSLPVCFVIICESDSLSVGYTDLFNMSLMPLTISEEFQYSSILSYDILTNTPATFYNRVNKPLKQFIEPHFTIHPSQGLVEKSETLTDEDLVIFIKESRISDYCGESVSWELTYPNSVNAIISITLTEDTLSHRTLENTRTNFQVKPQLVKPYLVTSHCETIFTFHAIQIQNITKFNNSSPCTIEEDINPCVSYKAEFTRFSPVLNSSTVSKDICAKKELLTLTQKPSSLVQHPFNSSLNIFPQQVHQTFILFHSFPIRRVQQPLESVLFKMQSESKLAANITSPSLVTDSLHTLASVQQPLESVLFKMQSESKVAANITSPSLVTDSLHTLASTECHSIHMLSLPVLEHFSRFPAVEVDVVNSYGVVASCVLTTEESFIIHCQSPFVLHNINTIVENSKMWEIPTNFVAFELSEEVNTRMARWVFCFSVTTEVTIPDEEPVVILSILERCNSFLSSTIEENNLISKQISVAYPQRALKVKTTSQLSVLVRPITLAQSETLKDVIPCTREVLICEASRSCVSGNIIYETTQLPVHTNPVIEEVPLNVFLPPGLPSIEKIKEQNMQFMFHGTLFYISISCECEPLVITPSFNLYSSETPSLSVQFQNIPNIEEVHEEKEQVTCFSEESWNSLIFSEDTRAVQNYMAIMENVQPVLEAQDRSLSVTAEDFTNRMISMRNEYDSVQMLKGKCDVARVAFDPCPSLFGENVFEHFPILTIKTLHTQDLKAAFTVDLLQSSPSKIPTWVSSFYPMLMKKINNVPLYEKSLKHSQILQEQQPLKVFSSDFLTNLCSVKPNLIYTTDLTITFQLIPEESLRYISHPQVHNITEHKLSFALVPHNPVAISCRENSLEDIIVLKPKSNIQNLQTLDTVVIQSIKHAATVLKTGIIDDCLIIKFTDRFGVLSLEVTDLCTELNFPDPLTTFTIPLLTSSVLKNKPVIEFKLAQQNQLVFTTYSTQDSNNLIFHPEQDSPEVVISPYIFPVSLFEVYEHYDTVQLLIEDNTLFITRPNINLHSPYKALHQKEIYMHWNVMYSKPNNMINGPGLHLPFLWMDCNEYLLVTEDIVMNDSLVITKP
ncbi:uncharacterized protein LOC111089045 [Limulus polyphemus]|uniref:Uncharacterized protein LOC111089045 n=1 Tax=Limulus polyphemus TaxID=6850 RepID=A0ABM1TKM5_LIMPO|nr:uncharacterized protein LOC111089045 [Limulus polyphemus]